MTIPQTAGTDSRLSYYFLPRYHPLSLSNQPFTTVLLILSFLVYPRRPGAWRLRLRHMSTSDCTVVVHLLQMASRLCGFVNNRRTHRHVTCIPSATCPVWPYSGSHRIIYLPPLYLHSPSGTICAICVHLWIFVRCIVNILSNAENRSRTVKFNHKSPECREKSQTWYYSWLFVEQTRLYGFKIPSSSDIGSA